MAKQRSAGWAVFELEPRLTPSAAVPQLVRDIATQPEVEGSYPAFPVEVNGTVFFAASAVENNVELWASDGTSSGTRLVKEILPGGPGADPRQLTNVAGTLFFLADDGIHGKELWKSDGTSTVLFSFATSLQAPHGHILKSSRP